MLDRSTQSINVTESDVYHYFGSSYAQRGSSYQRGNRVVSVTFVPSATSLMGRVQGSATQPYDVTIKLSSDCSRIMTCNCSCPMSGYCKHSAALLLDVIRNKRVAPVVKDEPKAASPSNVVHIGAVSHASLSPELLRWVTGLGASVAPQAALKGSNDSVLYILEVGPESRLWLNTRHAKRLKTGNWGKPQRVQLEKLTRPIAQYITEDDSQIAKLFLAAGGATYQYRNSFPDVPEICKVLLERLVSTGRCYWQEVSGSPLKFGVSKQGSFTWETQADGKQLLRASSGASADITVIAGVAWYVNPNQGTLGPLVLPGSPETVETLLKAPPVEPHEALALAQVLAKFRSLVPPPKASFKTETIKVKPTPRLTLAMEDQRYSYLDPYGQKVSIAHLSFDYDNKFKLHGQSESRTVVGDKIIVYQKDEAKEAAFVEELKKHGLRQGLRQGLRKWSGWQDASFCFPDEDEMAWFSFAADVVPELEKKGWLISRDKSFNFEAIAPEERWQADAAEGADFWFSLDLGITVDGKRVPLLPIIHSALRRLSGADPLTEIERLQHNGVFYAPLPDGRHVALPFERVKGIVEALLELFDKNTYMTKPAPDVSLPQLMKLVDTIGGTSQWLVNDRLKRLLERIKQFNGLEQVTPPRSFQAELRAYQMEGLSWLNFIREFELGGILADDMGLGKTVQTLAHIACEKSAKRLTKPFLVVCPTSVLPNWLSEIEKFTPNLKTTTLWGSDRALNFKQIPQSDVVVTTYPLVARDMDVLVAQGWKAIVLDEAQMIKNPSTQAAQALRKLRSDYRLCLTGTPVENHLGELWSQFDFLLPGFLKDLPTFTRTFRQPIEKHKSTTARKILASQIKPFLLRRTKELVAKELPEKTSIIKRVELEGAQRDLYETVRLAMYEKVQEALSSKGLAKSQIVILDALLKLRQVCCDPRLVSLPAGKKVQSSAKFDTLMGMLEELLLEDKKILLFSQFTSMLDLIAPELQKRQFNFVEIRGDTKDRATPVQQFQSGKVPLFLLSLKAGGFGLNLTEADTVIHYDPWWNPAVENQATDRAHRIGQKKSVFVFKLIASGTIEERMLQLQERKKAIAEGIYGDENDLPFKLTAEDLESLFKPLKYER